MIYMLLLYQWFSTGGTWTLLRDDTKYQREKEKKLIFMKKKTILLSTF